jgi:uncharacterized protein YecE (DUF72 family)
MPTSEENRTRLYIGPAGWSYEDWKGRVYPDGSGYDKLLFISRYFNCVELNSSFYRMPSARIVDSWARRLSPLPDFRMPVKVLRRFSHERRFEAGEPEEFISRFSPLLENGIAGPFLIQFPWSFRRNADSMRYIERLGRAFEGFPTVVEVRHGSWEHQDTIELLSGHGLIFCNIDQPLIGDSLGPSSHITNIDTCYIRLHGRNRADWFRRDAGRDDRYNYLYSHDEMVEWSDRIRGMMSRAGKIFVITNNHFGGQALVNAFQLRHILEGKKPEAPPTIINAYPELAELTRSDRTDPGLPL